MTRTIVLFVLAALALFTLEAEACGRCNGNRDNDWTHHHYAVLEISTTDIGTPSTLFFGTAPLQNDVWANLLYTEDGTEVVGFDVGLCTVTPPVNNTGSFYELCNIIQYFNDGADQVVLSGAVNFIEDEFVPMPLAVVGGVGSFRGATGSCTTQGSPTSFNAIYVCDFWTPNFSQ